MQITSVTMLVHRRPPSVPGMSPMPIGVLEIGTDEGIAGHAFVTGPGPDVASQLVGPAAQILVGRDPLAIGAIWHEFQARERMFHHTVQGYVDIALWDIAGKVAGLPVHRLLGSCRSQVAAYASSWVHPVNETYAEEALAYREQGFAGYKLHPPTQRRRMPVGGATANVAIAEDLETCSAVREAVGSDYRLMLDSAWAYSYKEALDVGFGIQELDYLWYEDPLGAEDMHGYVRLKQHLHIPIVATEVTGGGQRALTRWIAAHATDALRGDVVIKGGITGMMKIAALAEAYDLPCEVHDAYNALGNLATVHVVMAVPSCSMYEVLVPHAPGSYDLAHLSYGLVEPIAIDGNGVVHAPERPGLGIDIDWELIRSDVIAEL